MPEVAPVPVSGADPVPSGEMTPVEFLKQVMLGKIDASPTQVRAAGLAAQYEHAKPGTGGAAKQAKRDAAKAAGAGRFAPTPIPPKLKLVK